jgi:hypothetical protein
MRPATVIESIGALDWEPLGTHGIKRKLLSADPVTGAVTQYVHIPENCVGGGVAHYHTCMEEAFIIEGDVSLIPDDPLVDGSYLYRPPYIVHGHDERADKGCLCIIRMGGEMDFNLVHEPKQPVEYAIEPVTDPRGHVLHLKSPGMTWQSRGDGDGRFDLKLLSKAGDTGAYTGLVKLPPGWRGVLSTPSAFSREWVVLSGCWQLADGSTCGPLSYRFFAKGTPDAAVVASDEGCLVLTWCEVAA